MLHNNCRSCALALGALVLVLTGCESSRATGGDSAVTGDSKVAVDGKALAPDSQAVSPDSKPVPDSKTAPDSKPPGGCPAALPAAGGACQPDGLACQYGSDPRRTCRPVASCASGKWQVTSPKCKALPPITCPATYQDAAGKKCTPQDAYCAYPGDLVCHCTNCISYPVPHCSGDPTWRCDVPCPDAKCPPGKPNLGTPCTTASKQCAYHCGNDGARICNKNLIWTAAMGTPCPISSRHAKKEITYLSPPEAKAIARKLLKVKLATYRYRDPTLGRDRKLGFILEDVGRSYAGDPARGRVDLYGYTSMLLATVQAQQRTIQELQRQVKALSIAVKKRR